MGIFKSYARYRYGNDEGELNMLTMDKVTLTDKWVLIREDFNVPMKDGKIAHSARIDAAIPTLNKALSKGAKVIVMSHLGRPKEGQFDATLSLAPIAEYLRKVLGQPIPLFTLGSPVPALRSGEIALLENIRFLEGEEANSEVLAKKLASLCDIFVMDAFAVAHRAQASTVGVAQFAPIACAGPLLQAELQAIEHVLVAPQRPVVAIVGGSKISTKLKLLRNILDKVDTLVVGGGIANTFLAACGMPVGESLYEQPLVTTAKEMLSDAQKQGKTIWLPTDVVVGHTLADNQQGEVKDCSQVQGADKIFDIGPQSQLSLAKLIGQAKTVLWNGPVGVFECAPFAQGTQSLAKAIVASKAFSVAGGGDTLAAIEQFGVQDKISYLSTGGGAFLEALEGHALPAVAILELRSNEK